MSQRRQKNVSPQKLNAICRRLLGWYDTARRDLPWRRTDDPYAIWVAETMLQQTQVATVARHYERFLGAFPTVQALDRAPLRKVLALWSGLGYYRRAENLKKSARQIVSSYGGRLPQDYDSLLSLPGVGDYTAGAVMSIAFSRPYPALDGNARRVLSRLFGSENERALRQWAAWLVPKSQPGSFNQSLMELGATTCVPRTPRCHACPIVKFCATQKSGQVRLKVGAKIRPAMSDVVWPLGIVRRGGKILVRRRSRSGILRNLWELPGGENQGGEHPQATLRRHLAEISATLQRGTSVGEFRHSVTYRRIRSPVFLFDVCRRSACRMPGEHWRWLSPSAISRYPVSSMTHKALTLLARHQGLP